ncbi:hypothetical protein BsWGS_23638 [Bradybaena similaris]
MFFSAEDDDQDFMSTGGSKLANLFGMDKASRQGGNESLTYTAPKQPKKKDAVPDGSTPSVVVASIVHAYKYVDNKYASQGKLGAALLSTPAAKDYRILLYLSKQQQVTSAKITSAFSFNVQQNNYASFYDDARLTWSLMFETTDAAEKFAKEIALAKANCGAVTDLIQQDLSLGEGGGLETGDSAEVKYTGWLLTNGALGKVFDQSQGDNYFRFKIGKGKVIKGWDQGMQGMKKGGKRLLIIPPSLAYGSQGVAERVPPNSTLVFEVHVMRVKLQKGDSPSESPAPLPTMASLPDQDEFDDPGVKGRTRSINEHVSQSSDSGKAKLISRMARMGQPMLPFQGAVAAQPEDSDEELQHQQSPQGVPTSTKPPLPTKPRSSSRTGINSPVGQTISQPQPQMLTNPSYAMVNGQPMLISSVDVLQQQQQQQQPAFLQNLQGAQQLALYQNPNTFLQQQQAVLLQQQQQQQLLQQQQQQLINQGLSAGMPGHQSAFGADALAPVLLTETRQQNTEVRLGLSKMSDKVDKILEKVEHLNAASLGAQNLAMMAPYGGNLPAPSMEANVLMQNVSRIVQENERLKKEVYEQSNKVQELNEKISTLLEKNQKYVEQSQSLLEQRNEGYKSSATQSQARVLALEQEKVQLATDLSTASAQITTLQLELGEYRKREGELKQQLQMTSSISSSSREELERLRLQKEEDGQKIISLSASIRDEKLARKSMETKLASHLEEVSELKTLNEALEKSLSERKRKATEERRKLEEDLEDAKMNYETTIEDLREKLRRQKSSVDSDTQSKMSKIEEDISREWQAKSDRMLTAAAEKYNRQLADLKEEKEDLINKVDELEKKLANVRSSGSSTEQQVTQLQDELAEMKLWKDKYDTLRSQAATMKERYEKRIGELEGEKEEVEEKKSELSEKAKEQREELQQKVQQLQQQVQHLKVQLSASRADVQQAAAAAATTSSSAATPSVNVASEVKKIMNSVFQTLRSEFDADESYGGSEVLATVLNVIKKTTLKLVNQPPPSQESNESEEEEDEESDKEEDEDVSAVTAAESQAQDEEEEEDEVDESGGREITLNTEEVTSVTQSPTSAGISILHTENASKLENSLVQGNKQADYGGEFSAPLSTNSSEIDSTALEDVPSLDDDVKDNISKENPGDISEVRVVENAADEDEDNFFSDESETGDKSESRLVTDERSQPETELEIEVVVTDEKPGSETPLLSQQSSDPEETTSPSVSVNNSAVVTEIVLNGEKVSAPAPESSEKNQKPEQTKQDIPAARSNTAPKPVSDSREPPPLFDDDDDDDEDSSLFGGDKVVSDKPGSTSQPNPRVGNAKPAAAVTPAAPKDKAHPGKKQESAADEDLKPQPPPPLFGDDSDDDDLDWLS